MVHDLFIFLVACHIVTGAAGAIIFWIPVIGKKGGARHRVWGRRFGYLMLLTGSFATAISLTTLSAPIETHPHMHEPAVFIRSIFGWMMIYLAVLTISLAWHGLRSVENRLKRERLRTPLDVGLQLLVIVLAVNCFYHGYALEGYPRERVLMMGISVVGMLSGLTNLAFIYRPSAPRFEYINEHLKALVGAGISVYTAFLAFGSVRVLPQMALNPVMWSIPIIVGVGLIVYHQQMVMKQARQEDRARAARRSV